MLCRYLLIIGNVSYKLGEWCVRNWDEISYSLKRVDYGGITRAVTSKFDFYGDAYDLIWGEYSRNYLHAEAYVVFETVNDMHIFSENHRYRLDFSSMMYDGILLSINAFDDTLSTLIKAKKNTQYEYAVSDLRENVQLYYDRMMMENKIEWTVPSDTDDSTISHEFVIDRGNADYFLPFYILGTPEIAVKNIIEVFDEQEIKRPNGETGIDIPYFIKNISAYSFNIHLKVNFTFYFNDPRGNSKCNLKLLRGQKSGASIIEEQLPLTGGASIRIFQVDRDITLNSGDSLFMEVSVFGNIGNSAVQTIADLKVPLTITFNAKDNPVNIDIVKPVVLLNRLLKSINGNKDGIVGEIEYGVDNRLDNAMIVAAESARGLDAKLYTSYSKFEKWMNVMFGYVPIITNNSVKFVHRDSNYTSEKGIEFEDVNGFEYSIADGLIYSQVRVGYEKKEYDSVNGRDEFRWTNDFNTGLTITDNTLEMISPYRADAYGIELLVSKRGEDTTDNSSDNDVFFVCVSLSSDKKRYELVRDGYKISGVISPDTMFNSMYSPRSILQANKRYLGVATSILKFASSEGNSNVIINGVREQDDFIIDETERLFTVGEVSFKSTISFDEENLAKICTVIKDGLKYELYPLESTRKYGKYDGTSYKMCVKSILK